MCAWPTCVIHVLTVSPYSLENNTIRFVIRLRMKAVRNLPLHVANVIYEIYVTYSIVTEAIGP